MRVHVRVYADARHMRELPRLTVAVVASVRELRRDVPVAGGRGEGRR